MSSVRDNIIAGVIDAIDSVKSDSSYPIKVKAVKTFDENYLTFENQDVPAILVNDLGQQSVKVRNGQSYKYGFDFYIIGFVNGINVKELRTKINDIHSFILKFIDSTSGSDIHANAQNIEYEGTENQYAQSDSDPEKVMGVVVVSASMRYYISGGSF